MPMVRAAGVRSFCVVPLTTARRRLGAIGIGSQEEHRYERGEVEFLQRVAKQVGVAVDNVLNFESAEAVHQALARERDRLNLLLNINNAVVSHLELHELLKTISSSLGRVIPHDLAGLTLYDSGTQQLVAHALDFPQNQDFAEAEGPIPLEGTPEGLAFTSRQTVLIKKLNPTEFHAERPRPIQPC
jgi:formate hydrogenlyase transcriptional activator